MSDNGNVIDITAPAERDAKILALRLAGVSIRQIAHEFKMTTAAVLEALDRTLPHLDAHTRARYLRESLAELDQLLSWWHMRAKDSAAAAHIVLKIAERRACMLGLDTPSNLRIEIIGQQTADAPNSTAQLLAALDAVANERPPLKLVAEAEAPGEPEPDPPPPATPAA
jgi:hypothetical protein